MAVFIPLLLMSGLVGRLFHEFAVTVTMTIAVSAIVSLTLSPMMGALFLRDERHVSHGRFYMALERGFQWLIEHYTRGLDFVLRHQRATLVTFLATVATAVLLYVVIPKGFFPQQDTGVLAGITDAPQDVSFDEMVSLERRLMKVIGADPAVAGWAAFVGGGQPAQQRLRVSGPQAARRARCDRGPGHHAAAQEDRRGARAARCSCRPRRT